MGERAGRVAGRSWRRSFFAKPGFDHMGERAGRVAGRSWRRSFFAKPGFDHAGVGGDLAGKNAGVNVGPIFAQAAEQGGA